MSSKKHLPRLCVVFDTSALFTKQSSELVKSEVRNLISRNSAHTDISIQWFLPSTVIDERRYQMRERAFELLPSLEKLEKLLGHNLGITKEILVERVDRVIQTNCNDFGIKELKLEAEKVDWEELAKRSVFRKAPFDSGKKEKGFRDALIAEIFCQLVNKSPATPALCTLALITDDSLMLEYVQERTEGKKNVRVFKDVSELEGLINTLVSDASEEYVSEMIPKAADYFFVKGKETTFYYRGSIHELLNEKFTNELTYCPVEDAVRKNVIWGIGRPVFHKKKGKHLYWTTRVDVEYELYRFEQVPPPPDPPPDKNQGAPTTMSSYVCPPGRTGEVKLTGASLLSNTPPPPQERYKMHSMTSLWLDYGQTRRIDLGKWKTVLEIDWRVTVAQTGRLSRAKVEDLRFVEQREV